MRFISNYPAFFRIILFVAPFCFFSFGDFIISDAVATSGLPSQQARFSGMSGTFKAKKKEAEAERLAEEAEAQKEAEQNDNSSDDSVTYFKLHTFVVNVIDEDNVDKLLLLTLEIFCKIQDSEDRWLIENHLAPIKDTIITYVSGQNRQGIQTQKQKKTLQKELTERVSETLKKLTGKKVISALYLTRIIVQ
ncbi:MAG: flagellar basal body-associated FliL family protein [Gammaproteobacteria bacterium]|nr:flagellar basal body-associated FliL family protein [Gammaproteobacteria bacterium]